MADQVKVLFVGSNPSVVSKTYNPFCKSTKSGQILLDWIARTCPEHAHSFCNVSDDQTRANRPLTVKEIKDCIPRLKEKIDLMSPDKIVALGKTAKMALTLLRLEFFAMEHPSGLNRKLNNKDYVEEKISGLREYLTHNLEFISND